MPTALLSVSDKTGIGELGRGLADRGWRLVSTGGTARALRQEGLEVRPIETLTGAPEMLGGRVKTLHPVVHAGILARRSLPDDLEQLREREIGPIDLVAVNLYPFQETVSRPSTTLAEALEQIDIGGPTLLRAAAKNHPDVWPVCDPADYGRVLEALSGEGRSEALRRELAAKVFRKVAAYDAAIASYLAGGEGGAGAPAAAGGDGAADALPLRVLVSLERVQTLRYGENPDQRAAFYREGSGPPRGIPALEQLQGKELSYNNLLDVDGALFAISAFEEEERPACAILKHTTPCGIAVGRSVLEAYRRALACDPMSAFGSVIAFSRPVTESVVEALAELFVECLVAPGYAAEALRTLGAKKGLRVLRPAEGDRREEAPGHLWSGLEARGVRGGLLVQSAARPARPSAFREAEGLSVPTKRQPGEAEWKALAFAWAAVQGVKSNAILLAREEASIGIGSGQMSRVDAVHLAVRKAADAGHETDGCVLASDAFFPFRDGLDAAARAGIRAVVQPGGSIRDEEVVAAADEHGIAMVMTGRRLFRH